jgi:DNA-binding XRE family transcriptional regulator
MNHSPMKSESRHTFGPALQQLRLDRKLTQWKLAELLGISTGYLYDIERGYHGPPPIERVQKMAEVLYIDADELMALAGYLPLDLPGIIQKQPILMPMLVRAAQGLTRKQLKELLDMARILQHKEGAGKRAENEPSENSCALAA